MPDSSSRNLRQPSWWAEGVQFARWDPFGFGVLTMPLLLFINAAGLGAAGVGFVLDARGAD